MNRFTSIFLIVFVLFFSINQQTFSNPTEIQNIIEKAKPDRSTPWNVTDSTLRFNEYFISTLDSACGFKAFGYSSKEAAIDEMLGALKDTSAITSTLRSTKLREFIDNDHDHDHKKTYSSAEEYLNNIKRNKHELSCQPNKNIYSKLYGVQKITEDVSYTLIDAFALLNNKNLYIYELDPSKNKTIFLSHSYVINNNAENLYLLRKGFHYNRLVPTKDVHSNNFAQNAETQYLEELRNYYINKYQRNSPYQRKNSSFVPNKRQLSNDFTIINNNQNKEISIAKNNKSIPDRSKPLSILNKPDRQFYEYSFADKDSESIYKGLGFSSRRDAMDALIGVLSNNDKSCSNIRKKIKNYISVEMMIKDHILKKIFKNYKKEHMEDYCNKSKNQIIFLNYIKKIKIKFELFDNVENGKLVKDCSPTSGYGIIDALALLKDKNLHVYHSAGNKQIRLIHLFNLDPKKPSIYLIDKDSYFNKLVSKNDTKGLKKAQDIEDKFNPIPQKKTSSHVIEIDDNTQSSDHIIHNNNYRSNVTNIRSRSNNIINKIQCVNLTEKEILNFLNDDSPHAKIRNFDFKTSCQKIYDHYTFVDINADNDNSKLEDDCALAILFLSKNFVPSSITKKEFIDNLLSKLNFMINTTGQDAKAKKYRHYARIYKARIYVAIQEYQKAWVELIDLYFQKTTYTKCYYLDMAELIIDYQFTPKNTTRNQALRFAKSLLRTTRSRPNSTKKSDVRSLDTNMFHPNYRNDVKSKTKEYELSKKIEAEENIISDDSSSDDSSSAFSSSDFSSDESDAENPFITSMDDISIVNPVASIISKRTRQASPEPFLKRSKINEFDEI